MAVNADAALELAKGFVSRRVFSGSRGSIVFVSSVLGIVGSSAAAAYSLSKGAVNALTRSLAVELAPRRIRVNCVAPGFVRTPMLDKLRRTWTAAQDAQVEALHPLGYGTPENVAGAVAFLLAETGSWITGTVLVVDGGYTAQ
jgi:NAD(P)-dependent dehydrogenase (short-subunit alcohol dehydrogenase family)